MSKFLLPGFMKFILWEGWGYNKYMCYTSSVCYAWVCPARCWFYRSSSPILQQIEVALEEVSIEASLLEMSASCSHEWGQSWSCKLKCFLQSFGNSQRWNMIPWHTFAKSTELEGHNTCSIAHTRSTNPRLTIRPLGKHRIVAATCIRHLTIQQSAIFVLCKGADSLLGGSSSFGANRNDEKGSFKTVNHEVIK